VSAFVDIVRTDPDVRRARAARVTGLYVITPDIADTDVLVARVVAALDGGAAVTQYRSKSAPPAARRRQARALARVHALRGALFIVNDDPDLARDVDADGVHLGEDDPGIGAARALVGPDRLIGVSCYDDLNRARTAIDDGADYVAFGSFFASAIKPFARRPDIELLVRARELGVPVVAIGGITSANAATLIDAGASAVAVISDVFAHDDPEEVKRAADAFAALFRGARKPARDARTSGSEL
jgi:thiamine-phosphate pyrophosphorylase